MSTNFDIKKFLIKEGLTRVSRDRKRLLKEESEPVQINQKAYELAKKIITGQIDGFVQFFGDNGMDGRFLPYDVTNDNSDYPEKIKDDLWKDVGTSDGIWAITYNPEKVVTVCIISDEGEEDRLYDIWEDLEKFCEDYYLDDDKEYDEETFEREVDPEVLDALKKGNRTRNYAWTYDNENPESTVIDSIGGRSSSVSRLTDGEYYDLYSELEDAGLMGR